jgi:hypothetical protein
MRTLPTELINDILCYLPFHELWKHFKTPSYDSDPLKAMLLCAMRRGHGFELSHRGFQHEITMQLAELEVRIRDGKRQRKSRKHKASCIEYLAKHNAKTICKYFSQTMSKDSDDKQRCCMDTLVHYVNEVALAILRQCLDMTTIPSTLVTLHFKICQYLLSAWNSPTPRTYHHLHGFLWSLPYSESEELFSSLEGSLWFVAQEAFNDLLICYLDQKIDPTSLPLLPSTPSKDKIFSLYVVQTQSPRESLMRLAIFCGIIMNLGGSIIESLDTVEDPYSVFELCLSVCESESFNTNDKILASSCILCFSVKSDAVRQAFPTFAKAFESWQARLQACLQQHSVQTSEELYLILMVSMNLYCVSIFIGSVIF